MKEELPTGTVGRSFTEVEFIDQYGDRRTIYKEHGDRLRLKKLQDSPSHLLNRAAAKLVGKKIKAARLNAGLSQADLVERAGLKFAANPKQRMYEIENAGNVKGKPSQGVRLGTLYAIASALGIETTDLLPTVDEVKIFANVDFQTATVRRLTAK